MSNTTSNIMVSIFVLTYNQEKYISQTINSLLNQKANFPFNIVIGDDCSSDKTLQILEDFKSNYPAVIKLIKSKKNNGLIKNYIKTIKQCDGKYIAICDGDDYWIDDYKIQKQVNFLENNKDFSIVFTKKIDLYGENEFIKDKNIKPEISDFDTIIKGNFIASVTVLFRNYFYQNKLPKYYLKYPYGDWPCYLRVTNDGTKIKFLNEYTAVYRKTTGITTKMRKKPIYFLKYNLDILKDIYKDPFFNKNKKIIKKSIVKNQMMLMQSLNKNKKYLKGIKLFSHLIFKTNFFDLNKKFIKSILKSNR